jgi:hypothetical protein
VFFGAPVALTDWFGAHGTYVAWSDDPDVSDEPLRSDANSLENACRLSQQWLDSGFGAMQLDKAQPAAKRPDYQHTFRTFAHSPRPMLKSLLLELELHAPDMFDKVRSTVFRVWDKPTIVSDFVLRWALARGIAKVRDYTHLYVSTGDADMASELGELLDSCGELDFFCINDTTDDAHAHDARLTRVRETLEQLFPVASGFERPLGRTAEAIPGQPSSRKFEELSAA